MTRIATVQLLSGNATHLAGVDRIMRAAFDPRFGEAWTQAQVGGMLALPGVALVLAAAEGAAIGFALTRRILDEAELLLLAVDPAARKRGIGGALLRSVIDECRMHGVHHLHLEVRANNPAIALYRRVGFVQSGVRPGYYRGVDRQLYDAHSYSLRFE
ncbi:ribosomal protein S18-alanine N-acetyltransferase [Sphingomonas sp. CJ99]